MEGSNMLGNIDGLLDDTFRYVAGYLGLKGVRDGLHEYQRNFINYRMKVIKRYILDVRIS